MKNIYRIVLSMTLLLVLCACGSQKPEDAANSDPAVSNPISTWQEQYDLGVRYLSDENYEAAILAFSAAIEIDPNRALAYVGRGDAYIGSGETEENLSMAQTDYEKAIELDETNVQAYLGLADVYIRRIDYEKAIEILKEALEKTDNDQSIADKLSELESGSMIDSSGQKRQECTYDNSGHLLYYYNFTYDQEGKRASATSFDSQGNQISYISIDYNGDGKPLNDFVSIGDGSLGEVTFEYDELGNQIRDDWIFPDGVHGYHIYRYDETGNCIQSDSYVEYGDGLSHSTSVYAYDDAGNQVTIIDYDDEGMMISRRDVTYNSEGKPTSSTDTGPTGVTDRHLYHFNEQGEYVGVDHYDGNGNLVTTTVSEG